MDRPLPEAGAVRAAALPHPAWPQRLGELLLGQWQARGLAWQMALGALAATAGAAGLAALGQAWAEWPPLAHVGPGLPLGLALGGLLAAATVAWISRPPARALRQLAESARRLRLDSAPDSVDLPLASSCRELRSASVALRRMVAAHRAQRQALQERVGQLDQQLHQRTHELSTLQDLSIGLAQSTDLLALVDEALAALERTLDFSCASVWARDQNTGGRRIVLMGVRSTESETDDEAAQALRGRRLSRANLQVYEYIERSREPYIDNHARQGLLSWLWEKVTDDARTSALYRNTRSWMGVPLQVREQVLGVLRVDHGETGYFDPARARLLSAVSSQTALAMHHAQLMLRERELAVVAERNRIARELHDAVSQTLFAANVIAGTLARQAERMDKTHPPDMSALVRQIRSLEQLNRGALAEMRMLLFELRPDALEGQSLAELLKHPIEAMACRGDIQVHADVAAHDRLSAATRAQVYRMAQELLTNLARHSGASQAWVQWCPDAPEGPTLSVKDDGQGFNPEAPRPGHFGLDNVQARAAEIGAHISIHSAPDAGTEIRLVLAGAPAANPASAAHEAAPHSGR